MRNSTRLILAVLLALALPANGSCSRRDKKPGEVTVCFDFAIMDALLDAIEKGLKTPENWMLDPGFALDQENMSEREMDMWGCKILQEE